MVLMFYYFRLAAASTCCSVFLCALHGIVGNRLFSDVASLCSCRAPSLAALTWGAAPVPVGTAPHARPPCPVHLRSSVRCLAPSGAPNQWRWARSPLTRLTLPWSLTHRTRLTCTTRPARARASATRIRRPTTPSTATFSRTRLRTTTTTTTTHPHTSSTTPPPDPAPRPATATLMHSMVTGHIHSTPHICNITTVRLNPPPRSRAAPSQSIAASARWCEELRMGSEAGMVG